MPNRNNEGTNKIKSSCIRGSKINSLGSCANEQPRGKCGGMQGVFPGGFSRGLSPRGFSIDFLSRQQANKYLLSNANAFILRGGRDRDS